MILLYGIVPFVLSFLGGYLAMQARHKDPEIEDLTGALERMTESDLQDVSDRVGEQHHVTLRNPRKVVKALTVAAEMNGGRDAYARDPSSESGIAGLALLGPVAERESPRRLRRAFLQDSPTPGGSLRFAHRGLISFTPPACKTAARKGCSDISPGLSEAIPGVIVTLYTDAR